MLIPRHEDPYHRRAGNILCGRLCKVSCGDSRTLDFYVAALPDAGLTAPYMTSTWYGKQQILNDRDLVNLPSF
jgi:hypothetical protein